MADGQNPFMGMLNPNMRQTSLWDLRMMSAANRSETPFERGARGMYRRQGVAGDPMLSGLAGLANEPDYSRFTFDPTAHAAASQALSRYGLAPLEASQVKQNQVLPNTGFFGNHPRLSAALEGGLFGALASHGGETPGESIQGALEGLVGGRRIQQGMYRQQFARPFEAAGMMEQLSDMQQKHDLQEADIQHLRVMNAKAGRPDHDYRAIGNAGPLESNIPVLDVTTGQVLPGAVNPNFDPDAYKASHRTAGAGTDFDRLVEMRNAERVKAGKPPLNSDEIIALRGKYMASPVGPGDAARLPYQNYQDAQREHNKRVDQLQGKLLKSDDPGHQKQARTDLIHDRMQQATEMQARGEKIDPNFLIPSSKDVKAYIDQQNQATQQQIDAEQAAFVNQWPQALEAPPAPKGSKSSRQTGSSSKIPTYNPTTGRLE